jgi:hypothetical protein
MYTGHIYLDERIKHPLGVKNGLIRLNDGENYPKVILQIKLKSQKSKTLCTFLTFDFLIWNLLASEAPPT